LNSRTDSVEEDPVLIRPVRGRGEPPAAPDLILGMTRPVLDRLVERTGARETAVTDFGLYRAFEAGGPDTPPWITLAGPFIGAPQAVLGLERMIARGARRIWVTGWCGSLQSDLRIGDLVMPLEALSEEGTSRHYPTAESSPKTDPHLSQAVRTAVNHRGGSCRSGRLWTTDAPYRETRRSVRAFQEAGILAVDMEMSALLAVAAFRGVRLAALLVISDELFDLTWRRGFSSPSLREGTGRLVEALLEAVGPFARGEGSANGEQPVLP
jgi:uridine phosphorylase